MKLVDNTLQIIYSCILDDRMDMIFGKPREQQSILKLKKLLNLLSLFKYSSTNPNWVLESIVAYKKCEDENIKQKFRLQVQEICNLLNKQIKFIQLVRKTQYQEGQLSISFNNSPNNLRKQWQQQISKLMNQDINLQNERTIREKFTTVLRQKILNRMTVLILQSKKYQLIIDKIKNYYKSNLSKNPLYTAFKEYNIYFNYQELQIFKRFEQEIDGSWNLFQSKKEYKIYQITDQLQKASTFQELQQIQSHILDKYKDKCQVVKLINYQKRLLIFETALAEVGQELKAGSRNLDNIIRRIQFNTDIDSKLKKNFRQILYQLKNSSQMRNQFEKFGLQMNSESASKLIQYLRNMEKILKNCIDQVQRDQQIQNKFIYLSGKQSKNNPFKLLEYIKTLIPYLNTSKNSKQPPQKDSYQNYKYSLQMKDKICISLQEQLINNQKKTQMLYLRINELKAQLQAALQQKQQNISIVDQNIDTKQKQRKQTVEMGIQYQCQEQKKQQKQDPSLQVIQQHIKKLNHKEQQYAKLSQQHQSTKNELQLKIGQNADLLLNTKQLRQQLQLKQQYIKQQKQNHASSSAKMQEQIEQLKKKVDKLLKEQTNLEKIIESHKNQNEQVKANLEAIKLKQTTNNNNGEDWQQKTKKYQQQIKQLSVLSYFNGNIFQKQEIVYKQLLLNQLYKLEQQRISKTVKVYGLDLKNPTSPHQYIDGVTNWVLLFKLENGYIVGAYCHDPIVPGNKDLTNVGFMFSLNANKFYKINRSDKQNWFYQYNQFYIIIGNCQIGYSLKNRTIEHSFGQKFKSFSTGNDKPETFYGTKEEKIKVITYQFYQLIFDK